MTYSTNAAPVNPIDDETVDRVARAIFVVVASGRQVGASNRLWFICRVAARAAVAAMGPPTPCQYFVFDDESKALVPFVPKGVGR